jgi:hypothetical protein
MVDFSKLSSPTTPEKRQADEERRRAQEIEQEKARRQACSSKTVIMTLDRAPEMRFQMDGTPFITLHGQQDDRKTLLAYWYAPSYFDRDKVEAIFSQLLQGTRLKLPGYWKKMEIKQEVSFIFRAQEIKVF